MLFEVLAATGIVCRRVLHLLLASAPAWLSRRVYLAMPVSSCHGTELSLCGRQGPLSAGAVWVDP
jgi:hypothetical protein